LAAVMEGNVQNRDFFAHKDRFKQLMVRLGESPGVLQVREFLSFGVVPFALLTL
jgi:hypothetical protein